MIMPKLIKKRSSKAGLPPGTLVYVGDKKIEISDEEAEKIATIQNAVDYLKEHGVTDE